MRFWERAKRPIQRGLHAEASPGLVLVTLALVAVAWANSPAKDAYTNLWNLRLGIQVGALTIERSLHWIVNDGLMTIFFFSIGMEVHQALHDGALSERSRAALPAIAAIGGMAVPALVFLAFTFGTPATRGWGVPMATDIAFALGMLALLGHRAPPALRALLLALAVVDDIGAVLIIAFFYSGGVSIKGLLLMALGTGLVLLFQKLGLRAKLAYFLPSFVVWVGAVVAGLHPTIAGVLIGALTPVRAWLSHDRFVSTTRDHLDTIAHPSTEAASEGTPALQSMKSIRAASCEVISPAQQLTNALHPWIAFGVMPIFALANAGVTLVGSAITGEPARAALGVGLGLLLGKPLGVLAFSWGAMRIGLGTLPEGLGMRHMLVVGLLSGIGFTMALFIGQLAFPNDDLLSAAKIGILAASVLATISGLMVGRLLLDDEHEESETAQKQGSPMG